MKTLAMTLALSTLALVSTTAANAQVENFGYGVGSTGVLSYPAVLDNSAMLGACNTGCGAGIASPLSCAPLFGKHTYYDNGIGYGGRGLLGFGPSAYAPVAYSPWGGVNSFSAVIPGTCGAGVAPIAPVCGQRLANSVFDIRLFRFGFGFGRVNPRWDMRPAGSAF